MNWALSSTATRRVVDAPTRMFHWLLALCFTGAWLTSESERWQVVHAALGYTMLALLVFRLLYGWLGPRPVRWTSWATKLRSGWTWCKSLRRVSDVWDVNFSASQNFGLVLATTGLMVLPLPLLLSGHVLYLGSADWLEDVHEAAADAMLLLVFAHLGLLFMTSVLRGTNLALPMWRGCVPGSGPDLVASARVWLAIVLLVASVGFGFWAVL
jgi:cytochrome b